MPWTVIIILLVLWALGFLGPRFSSSFPKIGNIVHLLIVLAILLIVLSLVGVI